MRDFRVLRRARRRAGRRWLGTAHASTRGALGEMAALGAVATGAAPADGRRRVEPPADAAEPPASRGEALVLATWRHAARPRAAAGRRAVPGRHRAPAAVARVSRRHRRRRWASPTATLLTVATDRGSITLPLAITADARPGGLAAGQLRRLARCAPPSAPTPATGCASPPAPADRRPTHERAARRGPAAAPRPRHADSERHRRRPAVAGHRQGAVHLRLPGGRHAAHHLGRAPRRRRMQMRARPEPGRAVRPAAEPRRRHQARAQGGHHPQGGRQGRSSSLAPIIRRSRRSWPSR